MTTLEGYELRRAVADALGWRVALVGDPEEHQWAVYRQNEIAGWVRALTEKEAWERAGSKLPAVDSDLNTVAEMPLPPGYHLELTFYEDGTCIATLRKLTRTEMEAFGGEHTLPATAAWNAWLKLPEAVRKAALVAKENRDE